MEGRSTVAVDEVHERKGRVKVNVKDKESLIKCLIKTLTNKDVNK